MEEREGFEPSVRFRTPDFESGTFDHSATSPVSVEPSILAADFCDPNAKEASMSKALAGQAAIRACIESIEICGAHGSLATEHALLEKWFRDIKVYDIFEGTGNIQRVVISKRIVSNLKSF